MALATTPSAPTIDDRIPVTLLTGFLGSGKTTLLNRLVKQPGLRSAAVIINELGEIGLDHELVKAVTEHMVLLQNGCICCAIRSDLIETLHDLLHDSATGAISSFDRVVIETTGLADPAPILHTLMTDQVLADQFRLDAIITTVDAAAGMATLDQQAESVRQVAVADRILLTKTDLVHANAAHALRARLQGINPGALLIPAVDGIVDPDQLFNIGLFGSAGRADDVSAWLNELAYSAGGVPPPGQHAGRHGDRIASFCLVIEQPISLAVLDLWLEALKALQGPELLRLKGLINVAGAAGPVLVNGVQHIFHPPVPLDQWPGDNRTTRIVMIVRDMPADLVQDSLTFLRAAAVGNGVAPLPRPARQRGLFNLG